MRRLLFLLAIICIFHSTVSWRHFLRGRHRNGNIGTPFLSEEHKLPEEKWFNQIVDHFNPTDARFFKQRYFVNSDFYKQGGPVFILLGGEGPIGAEWMVEGQWIEYAKQFGAICFQVEHRYYGKSHPTSDLSLKNLVFLSSELALADFAYFIQSMKKEYNLPRDSKWIMFGGSYAGSLAAWMRVKYPHVVHGAVSTSGPLLAEVDFQKYFIVVANVLKNYSQGCVDAITTANMQFNIMLRHRIGQEGLAKKFNLCDPIDPGHTKRADISNLYETLASDIAMIVQYNKDNRHRNKVNYTIESFCATLTNESIGLPVDRFAYVNNKILNAMGENCLDYRYSNMIHELRNVSWNSEQAEGGRQWMYQTCAEFGFFQTSTALHKLVNDSFPVGFFIQQCIDIFGPSYNADLLDRVVERTNILYGALDVEVTNVVFVHGSTDPWHVLGITESSNPKAPAIYINGTAHCANMYPPSSSDSPDLTAARIQIGQFIGQWLNN